MNIITEKQKYYNNFGKTLKEKEENFQKSLYTYNKITGEAFTHKGDIKFKEYQNYLYYSYTATLLDKQQQALGMIPVFATFTAPSEYHPTTTRNNKKVKNPKYNPKLSPNSAYKLLNGFFRDTYKNFRIDRKYVSVKFIKVFEPHKDFTPHLHVIYYVAPEHLEAFVAHLKNLMKTHKLGKQHKILIVNESKINGETFNNAVTYLLKYTKKTLVEKEDDYTLYGWRKAEKIRIFRSSYKTHINREIFKKVSNSIKLNWNAIKDYGNYINILQAYEELVGVKYTCYENITDTDCVEVFYKETNITNNEYTVIINKQRTYRSVNKDEYKTLLQKLNVIKSTDRQKVNDIINYLKNTDKLDSFMIYVKEYIDEVVFQNEDNNIEYHEKSNSLYIITSNDFMKQFSNGYVDIQDYELIEYFYNYLEENEDNSKLYNYRTIDLEIYSSDLTVKYYDKHDYETVQTFD